VRFSQFARIAAAPIVVVSLLSTVTRLPARAQPAVASASALRMVVIVSRHGVRSPTDPTELAHYSARPWPTWSVAPGELTPHGAAAMTLLGRAYRETYASAGIFPLHGCPAADTTYVWADVDERTRATGVALLDGLAPNCGISEHVAEGAVDPLFHALPTLGKADLQASTDSLLGSVGAAPQAIVPAFGLAFEDLDDVLGCGSGTCEKISDVAPAVVTSPKSGLVELQGPVDLASTAVEDMILAYADGRPLSDVGWGTVDRKRLLALSQLHVLKFAINTESPYIARVQGSNLLAHVLATLDQGASGARNAKTRVPLAARFVAFIGHDTNLEEFAGMLRLRWLLPGYQINDTPPGGALVFEVRQAAHGGDPFVRVFSTAQTLDDMRTLSANPPERVPVLVPGCPQLDCPISTFDRVVGAAIDPAFVGTW
jgi:4-phytase/acid phosphatase